MKRLTDADMIVCVFLTSDHIADTTVRVDAADLFGMCRVHLPAKDESWRRPQYIRWSFNTSTAIMAACEGHREVVIKVRGAAHCAGWAASWWRSCSCRNDPRSTEHSGWPPGPCRTSPCTPPPPGPWWEPRRCAGFGSLWPHLWN